MCEVTPDDFGDQISADFFRGLLVVHFPLREILTLNNLHSGYG
jgi:hypothetical protein